ncbi:MAG: precorrin-6y C5,15-methyltransferase (decarboxylating) subunit CbiE [Eubacterium sp.]|nr:precorrin-6y C5,15-methyltransferase (decarboxylating) subunit CbiE [Eubacterium sp.]
MSEIAVIGIGMGTREGLTAEAASYIRGADLLIGARRMLADIADPEKDTCEEYLPAKIAQAIAAHPDAVRIAVLMSGDVGFFSGAKKLYGALETCLGSKYSIRVMPGISSVVYFCSQLHMAWEDVKLTSMHGTSCNIIGEICRHHSVFSILGTEDGAAEICRKLISYDLNQVTVHIGENLGYPDEKITSGKPMDFSDYQASPLSVILLENPDPDLVVTSGVPDAAFLRDKVPMTKEEVRAVSICKLRLTERSVVYDIGAGSGSCSVEAALRAVQGRVYAIEKNPAAVRLLYSNKLKFRVDNMEIIEGSAPEALQDLPVPTHAFLGGTGGNMEEILRLLLQKNPNIRVVLNAITLETVSQALEILKKLPFAEPDIACISVAKSKKAGPYHMMMGQNPVYVITTEGIAAQSKLS